MKKYELSKDNLFIDCFFLFYFYEKLKKEPFGSVN